MTDTTTATENADEPIQLLQNLETNSVEELLRVVDFLFPHHTFVNGALALLTTTTTGSSSSSSIPAICHLRSPNRRVTLVQGKTDTYLCYPGRYCSCRSFLELSSKQQKPTRRAVVCKHLLAILLQEKLETISATSSTAAAAVPIQKTVVVLQYESDAALADAVVSKLPCL